MHTYIHTYIQQGHTGIVQMLNFNDAGVYLVSASYDHSVRVWDFGSGEMVWYGMVWFVECMISYIVQFIVNFNLQKCVSKLWYLEITLLKLRSFEFNNTVHAATFVTGTSMVAFSEDHTYGVWDVVSGNST